MMKRFCTFTVLGMFFVAASATAKTPRTGSVPFDQSLWGFSSGFGIEAFAAQKMMKRSCHNNDLSIAVIDTGIDPKHPALSRSLWTNEAERTGRPGRDDDGNGFVDDIFGWDFVTGSGVLSDPHGHGTHIAGIIAGQDEASGFKGVCPGARIMSLRYYDPKGSGDANLRNTIRAIEYAVQMKVDIINYSGGGAEFSTTEFRALKKAEAAGILMIAAAGNEQSNADQKLYFPAAYELNNIVSVTAINEVGVVLPTSNWGVKKVTLAAPGRSILSALPTGYGYMTGTSQATAFVTGIAALLKADDPSRSMMSIKKVIENSAKPYPQLVGKTKTGAKADAVNALAFVQSTAAKSQVANQQGQARRSTREPSRSQLQTR